MKKLLVVLASIALFETPQAQSQSGGVPVKLIATAESTHGREVSSIPQSDVTAYQDHKPATLSSWIPATGANAALQLYVLIDDASGSYVGTELSEIRQFITSQPETTLTGVAYMQNGTARIVHKLTAQHQEAANSVRLPLGAIAAGSSPYIALSDLIKHWPATSARREVVMITPGVDALGGPPPVDPYLDTAIADAQRAGIVVFTIYTPHVGHFGHSYFGISWAQNYLAELSEDTGADMFGFGNIPPVSFAPFFKQISDRLANQYIATVLMVPGSKAGFEPVRLITKTPNTDIVTQTRVYVPLGG
jgi:hypothetical protein